MIPILDKAEYEKKPAEYREIKYGQPWLLYGSPEGTTWGPVIVLDERDMSILKARSAAFLARKQVKQGDFIRFSNGVLRRVSHVWTDENDQPNGVQTTMSDTGGSFYLGEGYMSYSGGLHPSLDPATLTRTEELMNGPCWFFRHDYATAGGGVNVYTPCPVWNCSMEANQ